MSDASRRNTAQPVGEFRNIRDGWASMVPRTAVFAMALLSIMAPVSGTEARDMQKQAMQEHEHKNGPGQAGTTAQEACPPVPEIPGVGASFQMPVTIRDGLRPLGKAPLSFSPEAEPALKWPKLRTILQPLLSDKALAKFTDRLGKAEVVTFEQLCRAGLPATFSALKFTVSLDIPLKFRRGGVIELKNTNKASPRPDAEPAAFAAYANLYFGMTHVAQSDFATPGWSSPDLAVDGALTWDDLVLEGEFSLTRDLTFERRTTRLVYDLPEQALRFKGGDVRAPARHGASQHDLLGFSLERSYAKLQPAKNTRPNVERQFTVYQPSDVDVFVNGRQVRSFRLAPGEYDLADLPLVSGGNEIKVEITEDSGRTRSYDFTVFHGYSLLEPGLSEWRIGGGFAARYTSAGRQYDFSRPAISGFLRHGIDEALTGEIGGHISKSGGVLDAAFTSQNWFGSLFAKAAASYASGSLGYSLGLDWQLDDFDNAILPLSTVLLTADYDSADFGLNNTGAYLKLGSSVGFQLPLDISGFASFNYIREDAKKPNLNASLSFSKSVGANASWNIAGSFRRGAAVGDERSDLQDWALRFGFNYRFSPRSRLTTNYDTVEKRATVGLDQTVRTHTAGWAAELEWATDKAEQAQRRNENALAAGVKYTSDRFTASIQHDRVFHGLGSNTLEVRSSAKAATAFAFADGRWAWGSPVGGAFAIVGLDSSVTDGQLDVGPTIEGAEAQVDFWGPALVSGLAPYVLNTIAVAGRELPADYHLGKGTFALKPAYKSGYTLTAGSAGRVAVEGRLVSTAGAPFGGIIGDVHRPNEDPEGGEPFFTTEDGRFFVAGVEPGTWHLTLRNSDKLFVMDVPEKQKRTIDVGALHPRTE